MHGVPVAGSAALGRSEALAPLGREEQPMLVRDLNAQHAMAAKAAKPSQVAEEYGLAAWSRSRGDDMIPVPHDRDHHDY
jgi:hypothetical protein